MVRMEIHPAIQGLLSGLILIRYGFLGIFEALIPAEANRKDREEKR